jgi:hypothetical protein
MMTMWRMVRHMRKSQESELHNISSRQKTELGAGRNGYIPNRLPAAGQFGWRWGRRFESFQS